MRLDGFRRNLIYTILYSITPVLSTTSVPIPYTQYKVWDLYALVDGKQCDWKLPELGSRPDEKHRPIEKYEISEFYFSLYFIVAGPQ